MTPWEESLLRRAVNTWGEDKQVMLFGEECCEAAVEVLKVENGRSDGLADLIAEIADVSIMVDQMRLILGTDLEEVRAAKLKRLEQRLNDPTVVRLQRKVNV